MTQTPSLPRKEIELQLEKIMEKKIPGLTIAGLARVTGQRSQNLHHFKTEKPGHDKRLPKETIEKICTYLNCDISELITLKNQKSTHRPPPLNELDPSIQGYRLHCHLEHIAGRRGQSLFQVSKEIEVSYDVLRKMARNLLKRYSVDLIERILGYFNIEIKDLFTLEVDTTKILTSKIKNTYEIYFGLSPLMSRRKISIQQLMDDTGFTYAFINKLMKNEVKRLNIQSLEVLCNYFNVPPTELIKYRVTKKES
ncbi:helix-turn-helix transcriptional regulator [Alkalihalobacillus oceani]|uniref:Helix-turn-helix transcriptional regulator n=1 Tax=Halalkalibacter oceani TaxID=1653776 RepID=A0A9X2IRA7_9BACI|nr:helix-turn-helix transcriptional regulator [Halalkalibacter oceani]MCM3716257.1 helix-turn-helix transcriptional regulator [Halalkalibacter oceani]